MSTPTQRSLKLLRDQGYTAEVVEHWNPHAMIRKDLFGFIDILALRGDETLAVQTTSRGNISARVRKIVESEAIGAVRDAGWKVVVHGWDQYRPKNKNGERSKVKRWRVKIEWV